MTPTTSVSSSTTLTNSENTEMSTMSNKTKIDFNGHTGQVLHSAIKIFKKKQNEQFGIDQKSESDQKASPTEVKIKSTVDTDPRIFYAGARR